MTDEESFQAALDANPEDYITRLVFADWLEEHAPKVPCPTCHASGLMLKNPGPDGQWVPCSTCHGAEFVTDPRGEGYRALGRMWWVILNDRSDDQSYGGWVWWQYQSYLGADWYELIDGGGRVRAGSDEHDEEGKIFLTPRRARDAASLAFAKLPPARRAELLATGERAA